MQRGVKRLVEAAVKCTRGNGGGGGVVLSQPTRNERRRLKRQKMLERQEGAPARPRFLIRDGQRHVLPYRHTYRTYCKGRWVGRPILEVLAEEYIAYSRSYFEGALASGLVTINGGLVSSNYVMCDGDYLLHAVHRHEPPTPETFSLKVVYETNDLVVVSKPAGLPVHPVGRYFYLSVVALLECEHGLPNLSPVHRLDRLTSGLMVLGKSYTLLRDFGEMLREGREVDKLYLARVRGSFPISLEDAVARGIVGARAMDPQSEGFRYEWTRNLVEALGGPCKEWVCDAPIFTQLGRVSEHSVSPDGRPSQTVFRLLRIEGDTSLVLCRLLTGRTHQIRLHLEHSGHPIANDPVHGGTLSRGNTRRSTHPWEFSIRVEQARQAGDCEAEEFWKTAVLEADLDLCPFCRPPENGPRRNIQKETLGQLHCSEIWLHSYAIASKDLKVCSELPGWALPTFDADEYLHQIPVTPIDD